MKISFNRVNEIIKTLPIGYYVMREVKVILSEDSEATYYSVNDDKIVVSYSNICKALNNNEDECDCSEEVIRTLLYHEVSHAMLTPNNLFECIKRGFCYGTSNNDHLKYFPITCDDKIKIIVNIFEDERVETLLKDYYLNVNFKKVVKLLNPEVELLNNNDFSEFLEFFKIVRMRSGDQDLVSEVSDLIDKYSNLNKFSEVNQGCKYVYDILTFYTKVVTRSNSSPENSSKESQSQSQSEQDESNPDQFNDPESSNNNDLPDDFCQDDQTIRDEESSFCENSDKDRSLSRNEIKELFNSVINHYDNKKLTQELERIFISASKIKKMQGSSINSYSGVFDPRSAAREDYRYFIRRGKGSGHGFSKVHINLFLDRSGSFSDNVQKSNELLYSLRVIERKYDDFSFTLITMGVGETIETEVREHYASGGTAISREIKSIFSQVQKNDASNFNIVLYDGLAWSKYRNGGLGGAENFSAFNTSNTVVIVDKSNEIPVKVYCKKARCVIVDDNTYTENLISNLISSLEMITR